MARQYKRVYELTIVPEVGEARVITDLRVSFEITKSILSFPNLARIVIHNPNKDTLAALQTRYTKLLLNAGYEGGSRLLFSGEIRNVFQSRAATESSVIVYAGDGERDWQNATYNKTFSENISVKSVIEDVFKTFQEVSVGFVKGLPEAADKLLGQTLSGSSRDVLDNFANEYGFSWSIQDGELTVVPDDEPLQGTEAVLVTSATGMVGSPTITEIGANVTTLLNPNMLPNRAFKIESVGSDIALGALFFRDVPRTRAEGFYKIQEAVFKGDSREGDWLTTVKGITLNG